jgi:hypothetical protein
VISLAGPLRVWTNDEGRVHFMSVPEDLADEIRAHAMAAPRGFGSVRVEASIHDVTWRTSVFPVKSGGYFLPVKIAVCRAVGIAAGDEVAVTLDLL